MELARRRHYREVAENVVRNMTARLEAMSEGGDSFAVMPPWDAGTSHATLPFGLSEEVQVRKHFNMEFGAHLPEDLCLCIENSPTR